MNRSARWYWTCQLAGWSITLAVNLGFAFAANPAQRMEFTIIYAWSTVSGVLLSHGWRTLLKRRGWLGGRGHNAWLPLAGGVIALGILQTFIVALAFLAVRPPGIEQIGKFAWLPSALLFWIVQFFVWTTLYYAFTAGRRARLLEAETLRLQVAAKDAELRALQAQVNPHFYFNSLNSLRALVYESPADAAQMIDQLAALMRYALQSGRLETVTLAEERAAVEAYLAIEKIRFEERLRLAITCEPGLDELRLPPMALQTLAENAVKYGVEQRAEGSDIRITMRREGDAAVIEVANSGSIAAKGASTGVGLENARRRLRLAHGPQASLELTQEGSDVVARMRLPLTNKELH